MRPVLPLRVLSDDTVARAGPGQVTDMAANATGGAGGRLWWIAAGLSLGPAVSNGIARFACGLLLPAMREDLGWGYAEARWLNTANVIGYLAGALLSLGLIGLIGRLGARRLFVWGWG